MFDSVLILCVGNICRSPTAEYLMRAMLPGRHITSAGLRAMVGKPADPQARAVAEEYGIYLDGHISQQMTRELCLSHELILTMEKAHSQALWRDMPEIRGKTLLYGQWLPAPEIHDPYRHSPLVFRQTFLTLCQATEAWVQVLEKS